jgi:hypothetical protein
MASASGVALVVGVAFEQTAVVVDDAGFARRERLSTVFVASGGDLARIVPRNGLMDAHAVAARLARWSVADKAYWPVITTAVGVVVVILAVSVVHYLAEVDQSVALEEGGELAPAIALLPCSVYLVRPESSLGGGAHDSRRRHRTMGLRKSPTRLCLLPPT